MSRSASKVVNVLLLVALAVAVTDGAGMRASMRAHACCAKMRKACARLESPADCCKRMGHTAAPVPATTQSVDTIDTLAIVSITDHQPATDVARSFETVAAESFNPPHDPPHLHTFALLI